jgi:hypothetical protein
MPRAYGRRPPKNAPAVPFAAIHAAGVLPAFPPTYDSIAGWDGWQMLGNDSAGDCVSVTWATIRRILTRGATYPTLDQVIALYRTQNPDFDPNGGSRTGPGSPADGGMDIQTLLEYLVKTGGPDGVKAVAFAKVDHTNLDEVKAALATFRTLWLGVNVTDVNQQQFPDQPWTTAGYVEGGHSIAATGYDAARVLMETWAAEASLADSYMTTTGAARGGAGVEEAWVVIWPEHLAHLTADQLGALATAYTEVTGKPLVVPVPPAPAPVPTPPAPVPTPTPNPGPDFNEVVEALWARLVSEVKKFFNSL